jgi:hypothetical protein
MAVRVIPSLDTVDATRERIVELVGRRTEERPTASAVDDTPVVLALQHLAVDNFVELIQLRTAMAEKDRRIATLTLGLHSWRERAGTEQSQRRRDAAEAHDRERELVSLLHQQMQVADSATAELERARSRSWWRRLFG